MSDALSFAEIDGQHVELLPARTVLSMVSTSCGCTTSTTTTSTTSQGGTGTAGTAGASGASTPGLTGGAGGQGMGKAAFFNNLFITEGDVYNTATGGAGGAGGAVSSTAPAGGMGTGMH